jgi:hypothetical protein
MMTTCNKGPHCTDLRASNIDVNGAFADEGGSGKVETCTSSCLYKLDDGEIVHLLVPNTIVAPPDKPRATLMCDAQVLEARHTVSEKSSDSLQTQLHFAAGGASTLPTINARPILQLQPADPRHLENHMSTSTRRTPTHHLRTVNSTTSLLWSISTITRVKWCKFLLPFPLSQHIVPISVLPPPTAGITDLDVPVRGC